MHLYRVVLEASNTIYIKVASVVRSKLSVLLSLITNNKQRSKKFIKKLRFLLA